MVLNDSLEVEIVNMIHEIEFPQHVCETSMKFTISTLCVNCVGKLASKLALTILHVCAKPPFLTVSMFDFPRSV